MSTIARTEPALSTPVDLQNGDRMTREEFHRAYELAPKNFKAELIGGVVHVPSPLRIAHANRHTHLGMLFGAYEMNTPGTQAGDNATVILGKDSEPQPDLFLRILPESGGQSASSDDDYVEGAPELVAEVAHSSRAIDLHAKREDYARYGVREYLVMAVRDRRLYWFDLTTGQERAPGTDGVIRIQSFPGFWIEMEALFQRDYKRLMATLQQGFDSPEHGQFVHRLATAAKNAS